MLKNFTLAGAISLCLVLTLPATKLSAQEVTANPQPFGFNSISLFLNKAFHCQSSSANNGSNYSITGIMIQKEAPSNIKGITINPNPGFNGMVTVGFTGDEVLSAKFTIAR